MKRCLLPIFAMLALVISAAGLAGGLFPEIYYYFSRGSFNEKNLIVDKVSYLKNIRPNFRRWSVYGKFEGENELVRISVADFDVSKISSAESLQKAFPVDSKIPVMVSSKRGFVINGRDVGIIPSFLAQKVTLGRLLGRFVKWNFLWLIVLVVFLRQRRRQART